MICKEDVILWFKDLESYKRIDTMCTLLNMCLPFELRFLGTCLEELGRRDSQELRGVELRVNNPVDLTSDMMTCQKGEPTDKKIRRKMALYLALIRSCNRNSATEIFRTLDGWGDLDFNTITDSDTLQELLLVYTMAANHPAFSFEQHLKFNEIFDKIRGNKIIIEQLQMQQQRLEQQQQQALLTTHQQHQQQHLPPPSTHELLQQHLPHAAAMHLTAAGQHQFLNAAPIQMLPPPQGTIPINFSQAPPLTKLIPSDGSLSQQITVDSIQHMLSTANVTIPGADSNTILAPHPNASWALRQYPQGGPGMEHPPQSSSPMLSQQSSPSSSRTTSPNRGPLSGAGSSGNLQQQQQQQTLRRIGSHGHKNLRRPSTESTPPPQQQHMMTNEMILPQHTTKNFDDMPLNNEGTGGIQLQTLIRNGYTRAGHHAKLKTGNYIHPHSQQQQQSSPVNQNFANFAVNQTSGLTYAMQNLNMDNMVHAQMEGGSSMISMNSNRSAGSDSGSSIGSSGELSPPETPSILSNPGGGGNVLRHNEQQQQQMQQKHHQMSYANKQMTLSRLNGRADKAVGNSNNTILYAPTPNNPHQPQQFNLTEILLAPGGNAGQQANNLLQQTQLLTNNNTSGGGGTSSSNTVTSNNNTNSMMLNTSSTTTVGGNGGGPVANVMGSNSVMLQSPHQQQYNANYPYHVAAQHLATTSRPPLIPHQPPGIAPPAQPTAFRLPGYQLPPPNGDIIYQAYHPAATGITFLTSGGAAPPPPVALRNSGGTAPGVLNNSAMNPVQQQPPTQATSTAGVASLLTTGGPFAAIPVGSAVNLGGINVNKPLSCYNCGSQTHSGRDCQSPSIDDVTRVANYKLDFSVPANISPTGCR